MRRLYLKGASDARKTPITSRAHTSLDLEVLWGSREDPKTAGRLQVIWNKAMKRPQVLFHAGPQVDYTPCPTCEEKSREVKS